jgi:hypothetical protein
MTTETTRMIDGFDTDCTEFLPSPRFSVQFDGDGTWSAWRGATGATHEILLACPVLMRDAVSSR